MIEGYIVQPTDQVASGFADLNLFHDVEGFEDSPSIFSCPVQAAGIREQPKSSGECVVICGIMYVAPDLDKWITTPQFQ